MFRVFLMDSAKTMFTPTMFSLTITITITITNYYYYYYCYYYYYYHYYYYVAGRWRAADPRRRPGS